MIQSSPTKPYIILINLEQVTICAIQITVYTFIIESRLHAICDISMINCESIKCQVKNESQSEITIMYQEDESHSITEGKNNQNALITMYAIRQNQSGNI